MDQLNNMRKYLIALIVIVVVTLGGALLSQGNAVSAENLVVATPAANTVTGVAGAQVFALLNQLVAIKSFDQSLFDRQEYRDLQDFTVDVGVQSVGRTNPFLPAGGIIKNQAVNQPSAPIN
jgi:hypothetical protein